MTNEQLLLSIAKKFSAKTQEYAGLAQEVKDNTYMKIYYGAIMKSMEESTMIILEALKESKQ